MSEIMMIAAINNGGIAGQQTDWVALYENGESRTISSFQAKGWKISRDVVGLCPDNEPGVTYFFSPIGKSVAFTEEGVVIKLVAPNGFRFEVTIEGEKKVITVQ